LVQNLLECAKKARVVANLVTHAFVVVRLDVFVVIFLPFLRKGNKWLRFLIEVIYEFFQLCSSSQLHIELRKRLKVRRILITLIKNLDVNGTPKTKNIRPLRIQRRAGASPLSIPSLTQFSSQSHPTSRLSKVDPSLFWGEEGVSPAVPTHHHRDHPNYFVQWTVAYPCAVPDWNVLPVTLFAKFNPFQLSMDSCGTWVDFFCSRMKCAIFELVVKV
jgi:hypothetical protein